MPIRYPVGGRGIKRENNIFLVRKYDSLAECDNKILSFSCPADPPPTVETGLVGLETGRGAGGDFPLISYQTKEEGGGGDGEKRNRRRR